MTLRIGPGVQGRYAKEGRRATSRRQEVGSHRHQYVSGSGASARKPLGGWVDKSAPIAPKSSKDLPEVSFGIWVMSSPGLLDGSDVTEDADALPAELFGELFAPKQDAPQKTGKSDRSASVITLTI
jgi:hypothetical protein